MQLIFSPPVFGGYESGYEGLILHFLQINSMYFDEHDIEVSYNTAYNFWDILLFKDCRNTKGNGTKEWLDKLSKLEKLFPDSEIKKTYRIVSYYKHYTVPQDSDTIDGIRFFVKDGAITRMIV